MIIQSIITAFGSIVGFFVLSVVTVFSALITMLASGFSLFISLVTPFSVLIAKALGVCIVIYLSYFVLYALFSIFVAACVFIMSFGVAAVTFGAFAIGVCLALAFLSKVLFFCC